jgi:4-alpha-glucanotransferase
MTPDGAPLGELGLLAESLGVQTSYWDTRGRAHAATPEALVAVLAAMGAPIEAPGRLDDLRHFVDHLAVRTVDPVVVHWQGERPRLEVRVPAHRRDAEASFTLELEEGGRHEGRLDLRAGRPTGQRWSGGTEHVVLDVDLDLGDELPIGYHRLSARVAGEAHAATLISAPVQVSQPGPAERTWGVLAPLYSLRTETAIGPHVGDLAALGRWIDRHGGRVVATLPILATFLDEPFDPSPYTPASQRFWNELYCDLEATPELAASPAARELLDDPRTQQAVAELRRAELFDHRAQYRLVRPVLEQLASTFFAGPASSRREFDAWVQERPEVAQYAAFRAATDATGAGWHAWDAGPGQLPSGFDPTAERATRFHLYVQWAMHRQLTGVAAELAQRDQRLYLDLPVGTHGDGFDTWAQHDLFAWGCGVGAPPDDFFSEGQNWGFPPVSPLAARASGHRHLAACVRHHMSAAGILRLDHVMGLHRLYWVPDGAGAKEGVYVHYPRDEQFAVLAVESARSGALVVGEDLGTVPDEARHALERHGLLGMYVSQFQLPGDDGRIPLPDDRQVASLDTHDTPTFAGWIEGLDIGIRKGMGLLDEHATAEASTERQRDVDRLVAALRHAGLLHEPIHQQQIYEALLRLLGASPTASVLVSLDDLLGETDPQNVPGTGLDRPNWVRKLGRPLADLAADDHIRAVLDAVQDARLSAHSRAQEETR